MTTAHIGEQEDIEIKMSDDIISYDWTILNPDTTVYDFTGLSALTFTVYKKAPLTPSEASTNVFQLTNGSGISQASNVISLDLDYSATFSSNGLGTYYYQITWENASSQPQSVTFGYLKVV